MNISTKKPAAGFLSHLRNDIPAGFVVFLVAIPLCLGIAHATGLPLLSGLMAGVLGGLIVPLLSNSQLGVSGPAAGLITIVTGGLAMLGGVENPTAVQLFFVAVFLGGLIQILLGLLRADTIAYFFPTSVIKGMLAAIGIILILKMLPHVVGFDKEAFEYSSLNLVGKDPGTFEIIGGMFTHPELMEFGAILIGIISFGLLLLWENTGLRKINFLPAALVVVASGIGLNALFGATNTAMQLDNTHLVNIDVFSGFQDFGATVYAGMLSWETLGAAFTNPKVWYVAFTIGLIASVETLLTIEAVDKMDPQKRKSSLNKELYAQGLANSLAGIIGAIPVTAVIVRSTAAMSSGGKTKMTAISHGVFLLFSIIFIGSVINMIPYASLAAVLIMVGYKLAKPALIKEYYKKGMAQFIPFAVTIVAIVLTDLMVGIAIGIAVGILFVLYNNYRQKSIIGDEKADQLSELLNLNNSVRLTGENGHYRVELRKHISFLNKIILIRKLAKIPEGSKVIVDGSNAYSVDNDIHEIVKEYSSGNAKRKLDLELVNFN